MATIMNGPDGFLNGYYPEMQQPQVWQEQATRNSQWWYEQLQQPENIWLRNFQGLLPAESMPSSVSGDGATTLTLIKKSIKQIKAEVVGKEAQDRMNVKIERLKKLGVNKQAAILEQELQVRLKLARIQEWDYKVLPYESIKRYNGQVINSYQVKVHIDALNEYCGIDNETEAKDRIIPDNVLNELETAQGRQIFDSYSILWVEMVKDPLLLGSFNGCQDYFLIAEWGEDVKFDDIIKSEKQDKEKK